MVEKGLKIIKRYPLFYNEGINLEQRLSRIFLLTGIVLSFSGFITGFVFSVPFFLNLPNLLITVLCFLLPIVHKNKWHLYTVKVLYIIGFLYFPFIYITNGGNDGAGPYYFLMIVIYFAFFLKGKKLFLNIALLLLFYVSRVPLLLLILLS